MKVMKSEHDDLLEFIDKNDHPELSSNSTQQRNTENTTIEEMMKYVGDFKKNFIELREKALWKNQTDYWILYPFLLLRTIRQPSLIHI